MPSLLDSDIRDHPRAATKEKLNKLLVLLKISLLETDNPFYLIKHARFI